MRSAMRTFVGGYRFKGFEGQPRGEPVEFAVPERVILSSGIPFLVKKGDTVKAGRVIARDDESAYDPVLSTVSGEVEKISEGSGDTGDGYGEPSGAYRITIRSDGSPHWQGLSPASWADLREDEIEERLLLSGAADVVNGGLPTRRSGCPLRPERVRHIIVRETESDVYNLPSGLFLGGGGVARCACALALLKRIMPPAKLHLALSLGRKAFLTDFRKAAADYGLTDLDLAGLPPKYPQDHEAVVAGTVLREDHAYEYGTGGRGSAIRLGVLVLDLQALSQIYDAVVRGRPALDRVIGLSGPGWSSNLHLRVRIGTPVREIRKYYPLRDPEARLVFDSAMTGPEATGQEAAISPKSSHLVALPKGGNQVLSFVRPGLRRDSYSRTFFANFLPPMKGGFVSLTRTADVLLHGEPRPCITCTFCDQVCPVRIHPHLLHRYVKKDMVDETLLRYRIFRCIDCNLCSYVCPSKIPVADLLKKGKEKLLKEGYDPQPYRPSGEISRDGKGKGGDD